MFINFKAQKNQRVYPAPLLPQNSLMEKNFCMRENHLNGAEHLGRKSGAGFTIIELIISIFVLSIAVVGIFAAFSVMVILTSDASDRLTAAYLAQEGMEVIRNMRDSNWLNMDTNPSSGTTWDEYFSTCESTSGCEVDYTTAGNTPNPYNAQDYLKVDANGFYSYQSCSSSVSSCWSKYKRKITITPIKDVDGKSDHILMVKAQVFWDEKPNILDSNPGSHPDKYSITTEGMLYDWYNYQ